MPRSRSIKPETMAREIYNEHWDVIDIQVSSTRHTMCLKLSNRCVDRIIAANPYIKKEVVTMAGTHKMPLSNKVYWRSVRKELSKIKSK